MEEKLSASVNCSVANSLTKRVFTEGRRCREATI